MPKEEISRIEKRIDSLEDAVKDNTKITQQGFEKMNGRVKKLELKEAHREGADSVLKGSSAINWNEIMKLALRAIIAALALSFLAIQIVSKFIDQGA